MEKRFDWKEPWESVSDAMNRVIDDFGTIAEETLVQVGCRPAVALRKTASAYELDVAVPGLGRADVNVTVEGRSVTVSGGWPERAEDAGVTTLRDELPRGRFRRVVRLPERVDADDVSARMAGGVLTVRLPLSEPAVRTEVPIEDADVPDEGAATS